MKAFKKFLSVAALLASLVACSAAMAQAFIAPVTPGASGSSNRDVMLRSITQPGHALAAGDFVRLTATNTYARAQANTAATAEVVGRVQQIVDGNNFTLNLGGYQTGLAGLFGGTTYYLSATTPGGLTATLPTAFVRPVLYAINANEGYVIARSVTYGTNEAVTLGSLALTAAGLDVQAGTVTFRAGADFATVGTSAAANFGATAFVRLTGASTQTLAGITAGSNGRMLTLVNAGSAPALLLNQSALAAASDRITTGVNGTVTLPVGGSTELRYDGTAGLWRVVGMYGVMGDVTGSLAASVVSSIRGVGVTTTLPTTSQTLVFDGLNYTPTTQSLSGDVTGTLAVNGVRAIRGVQVTTTLPTLNQLLQFNGAQYVPATIAVADFCDIKQSINNNDLNGWLVLNGRALSTLTATQQAKAAACGLVTSLPNTSGRVLIDTAVNSSGGSNSVSISQANIPNYNLIGGGHNHGINDPGHAHAMFMRFHNATGGGFNSGAIQLTDRTSQTTNVASEIQSLNATTGITTLGSGNLTIPSGGSGSALILPNAPFYGVRFKIYLGL